MHALLSEQTKLIRVAAAAAAGTTDVNGTGVDMQADGGWDGVLFLASFGTAAADNLIHAEQSEDNSSFADLEASEVDAGASDEQQWLDIYRPRERYVRPVAIRGTSSTLENMWAVLYRGRHLPYGNVTSGTIAGKALVSPAEGTK